MTEPRVIAGRYEVGALLGYGGMAEVHQATDLRLGRTVAIKILRPDLSRDSLFQSRFRREAKAAGSLNHPSIVAVYDTGEEQDGSDLVPYIVMEFIDGRTLREILRVERRIEPSRAMEIVAEVCAALDFSHRAGIVHRDVKPANVMITRAGAVKVMDFGIARAVADSAATMTQTAAVIGTAQYLSPEQARGETVDARSDVYSTGCLLYELVTGNPPFQGDSPVAVAYQHVRETAPVPSSLNPAVPRPLDSIVMKALAKNPMNRYQSAAEMRSDLQRGLASLPVTAEPVLSDAERTQFMAATPPLRRPNDSGPIALHEEDRDSGRRGAILLTAAVVVLLLVVAGVAYAVLHPSKKKVAAPPTVVTTTVPNLVGMKSADIGNTLLKSNLTLGASTSVLTCPVKVTVGAVCAQTPPARAAATLHTAVKVTVLTAPATVTVPSVTNLTRDEAIATLRASQLQANPSEVNSDQAKGTVIEQKPGYGQQAAPGSVVILQIANGKHRIPTDLVGLSEGAAKTELNNDAELLAIATKTVLVTTKKQNGKVQTTDPAPGTWVDTTTKVTLTIGRYLPPCPTTAPGSTSPPTTTAGSTSPPTIPVPTIPAPTIPVPTSRTAQPSLTPSVTPSITGAILTPSPLRLAALPTTGPTVAPTCQ